MDLWGWGGLSIHNKSDFEALLCDKPVDQQRCFGKHAVLPSHTCHDSKHAPTYRNFLFFFLTLFCYFRSSAITPILVTGWITVGVFDPWGQCPFCLCICVSLSLPSFVPLPVVLHLFHSWLLSNIRTLQ